MGIAPKFRRSSPSGRSQPSQIWLYTALAAAIGVAAIAIGFSARGAKTVPSERNTPALSLAQTESATPTSSPTDLVEVPNVIGATLAHARVVLDTAGFAINLSAGSSENADSIVSSQEPRPGTVGDASTIVTITAAAVAPKAKTPPTKGKGWIVVIDPGHQARSDSSPEAVGPGSKTTKPSVTGGTTGVVTDIPEYEIVLQISVNLQRQLEERGVQVVMTRTTNDVNLSNAERAGIANSKKADLFVRVHADGSPDADRSGISTLYPASTQWTRGTWRPSKSAASTIQRSLIRTTGAVDLGIVPRSDLTGFNYAKMPTVLVECGFMSNPVEDRLLASPHYQDKLADGIADGIVAYLTEAKR